MPKKNSWRDWIPAVAGLMALALMATNGLLSLCPALLAVPVFAGVLAVTGGWPQVAALCGGAALLSGLALPGRAIPVAVLWCLLSGAVALAPIADGRRRPIRWAVLCLCAWGATMAVLSSAFGGSVTEGLARRIADAVDRSSQRDTILYTAYSFGLSRLEGEQLSGYSLRGVLSIPEATRLQLLYSLRVSLEELLPSLICETLIWQTGLTTLLCTVIPDGLRRRRGQKGDLPAMEAWYIPRGMGIATGALALGWLMATLGKGTEAYLGLLCFGLFRFAFMLQGACYLIWLEKRLGMRAFPRNLWAAVMAAVAPMIPLLMGLFDQIRDARHLRPDKEVGQE